MFTLHRRRGTINVWPVFVDALASILLVFVFMLLVFVLAQFVLSELLTGRNRSLDELSRRVNELAETLSLERTQSADLRRTIAELDARLRATLAERDAADERTRAATGRAETAESEQARLRAELDAAAAAAAAARAQAEEQASSAASRIDTLNQQLSALREQLARLNAALEASEAKAKDQAARIDDLGQRLNLALARKVDELQSYRSEFFGRLRELLKDEPGIRIVGDRFVFQSELLFPTASADLTPPGRRQLARLAKSLKEVTGRIPPDIDWVLRIDGHTDIRRISTERYPSNWELSSARALSVVNFLVDEGIPANRLAAAGFGEFQPVAKGTSPEALARNRRIEIKLTQP